MPVQLNEPLNTLQRLCEELEYSELLDRAADTQDPFERMVRRRIHSFYVCFSVHSDHRSASNEFPLTEAVSWRITEAEGLLEQSSKAPRDEGASVLQLENISSFLPPDRATLKRILFMVLVQVMDLCWVRIFYLRVCHEDTTNLIKVHWIASFIKCKPGAKG